MEKEILLEVRHLSIGFESYNAKVEKVIFNAISDLSLTVHKREIVAIVGSSGSGKSLLAHAVMNILPDNARTGGTMFYKGELLTPERMNRLRGHEIAFIPQSVAFLDPLMQVGDQVVGTLGEKARALQQKAFEHFGLKQSVAKLYPFQLSGGMARRVLLSTSYVAETEMIIADEPTPGLDLKIAILSATCSARSISWVIRITPLPWSAWIRKSFSASMAIFRSRPGVGSSAMIISVSAT